MFVIKQAPSSKGGIRCRGAFFMAVFFSILFTAVVVHWSIHSGRLSHDPKADDVGYLLDGLDRLNFTYAKGLFGLVENIMSWPPHSVFSTLGASLAFAVAGVHDWAPYAFNGLLILAFLLSIVYISSELGLLPLSLIMILLLSLPVSIVAVHDFRPDYAVALASSIAIYFASESIKLSPKFSNKKYLVWCGVLFGLAFLIKPPVIVITMPLFFSVIIMIAVTHFWDQPRDCNGTGSSGLLYKLSLLCTPALLLAGWYYFIAYKQIYTYLYVNAIGEHAHLWKMAGGLIDAAKYVIVKNSKIFLGRGILTVLYSILFALTLALYKKDWKYIYCQCFVLAVVLFVVVILSVAKYNQIFLGLFQVLFILIASIISINYLYMNINTRVGYYILNSLMIIAILNNFVGQRPTIVAPICQSELSKKENSLNKKIINDIVNALELRGIANAAKPTVFVSFIGPVSAYSMQWYARILGIEMFIKDMHRDPDLDRFYEMSRRADFVVAARGGTPDIWRKIPQVDQINDSLIEKLSNENGFIKVCRYPTSAGGAIYLFENIYANNGGFTTLAEFGGFLSSEPPIDGSSGRMVRWGTWPESILLFESADKGVVTLFLSVRGRGPDVQDLEVSLNGSLVTLLTLKGVNSFQNYRIELPLVKGSNRLTFIYKKEPTASKDGIKRTVLFSSIKIDDPGRIIRR